VKLLYICLLALVGCASASREEKGVWCQPTPDHLCSPADYYDYPATPG
jgi:hypothetical protein